MFGESMNPTRVTRVEVRKLARFRADPKRVQIKVRCVKVPLGDLWEVTIIVDGLVQTTGANRSARKALVSTLQRARDVDVPGIDYYMEWTYEHPFGAAGVQARLDRG